MKIDNLTELCLAFSCSASKLNELVMTGDNFAKASETPLGLPYPIALGTAAKKYKLKIEELVPLFLQSNISNLIAAAQRLLPLGHKRATNILKNLFEKINEVSRKVLVSGDKDLFSSCYLTDTCTLLHDCLLYTSPSPRDGLLSRMPSSA